MNTTLFDAKHILPSVMLLAAATFSQAGSIQLTPVRVNLSNAAKVEILTVHNTGSEDSVMQVTLSKWSLDGEQYEYELSQDLVITPSTFRLAPNQQQIVRIGLRGSPPQGIEDAYRLVVEEVPPPIVPGSTGARMIVRHDLPVFVAPIDAQAASLDFTIECTDAGAQLNVTNIGNVHAHLRSVELEDSTAGTLLANWEAFDYLLPAAQKSWDLALVAPEGNSKELDVTMLTDQGSFTANVTNSCE